MSYMPGDDAEELRKVVRTFLAKRSSESQVRALMETPDGYDAEVWTQAASELGLQGLAIADRFGGSGVTPVELGVVFEEMGRVLFTGPFLSTVGLAATALMQVGDDDLVGETLAGIAAGTTLATVTWASQQTAPTSIRANETQQGWTVSGVAETVIDGAVAEVILVDAQTFDGPVLLSVEADASVQRQPLVAMDSTRKLAKLTFDDTPATLLAVGEQAERVRQATSDLAALYLAAEQLGGASQVLETAVSYAQTRIQFGRAIGSFQAIKHRCADMLIDVESARSVVYHGLWTAVHDPGSLQIAADLARSVASDAYQRAAADNLQIHGGIGFTWEHSAHLYLKRAKSSQLLMGPPARHRERLAAAVAYSDTPSPDPHAAAASAEAEPDELIADLTAFLDEHPVPAAHDRDGDRRFRESRFDAGLAVVSNEPGFGGRGLASSRQAVVEEFFTQAGAADHSARNIIGLGMALPTIHAHGTEAQREKFLRPTFSGEFIWCQLFSEPSSGSDLAGLATRAVRDGDDFVVNGQKVWTSLGHVADWGILLARTDPDVPKHKGLTYFLVDMRSAGVEVRPLRQITGEAEFNEVYLTDVRIPADNILGAEGDGWRVAMTTLANERVTLGRRPAPRGSGPIGQAVRIYRDAVADGRANAATTERLMTLWSRAEAARLTNIRASAQGTDPGPEGSIAKLQMAELHKAIYEFCVDLSGPDGLLVPGYTETAPTEAAVHGGADVRMAYLRSLANSIEGGTSEVLRNILGERVLGLPAEPRLDRDTPWKDVRRS
ncbi:acyl-CoA dehydrogenase [Mycolicibacterium vaccae]|uniref:acyl-CoA dehydrogenase n=1 Tax=Mycolicibacterium vaccae TaxID=1810 RepID=UPI003D05A845